MKIRKHTRTLVEGRVKVGRVDTTTSRFTSLGSGLPSRSNAGFANAQCQPGPSISPSSKGFWNGLQVRSTYQLLRTFSHGRRSKRVWRFRISSTNTSKVRLGLSPTSPRPRYEVFSTVTDTGIFRRLIGSRQ